MMEPFSRRAFLSGAITAAMVAAGQAPSLASIMVNDPSKPWTPTDLEVKAWLDGYKVRCQVFGEYATAAHTTLVDTQTVGDTRAWLEEMRKFDKAWARWQSLRSSVDGSHGRGYDDGHDGRARKTSERPDDVGFSYHNGYLVGQGDRRRRAI